MTRLLLGVLLAAGLLCAQVTEALKEYNAATDSDLRREAANTLMKELLKAEFERFRQEPRFTVDMARELRFRSMLDRMNTASPGTGAGTSIASLASVSEWFSGAFEAGTFQRKTDGAVSNLRVNALGAVKGLNYLFGEKCAPDSTSQLCLPSAANPLRGLSLAATFDNSSKDQATVAANSQGLAIASFIRRQRTLTSFQVRYELYNRRDPRDRAVHAAYQEQLTKLRTSPETAGFLAAIASVQAPLVVKAATSGLPRDLDAILARTPVAQREAAARDFVHAFFVRESAAFPDDAIRKWNQAAADFRKKQAATIEAALLKPAATLEFTHQRPRDLPDFYNLRFIGSFGVGRVNEELDGALVHVPKWDVTFNFGVNAYYDKPTTATRTLRDFQGAVQATRKMRGLRALGQPIFSVAGYHQYLTNDVVLKFNSTPLVPGTNIELPPGGIAVLRNTKGPIWIGQSKLVFKLGNSGVDFPLAISFSNRTELLKTPGTDVRGHFGLTFDMDRLLNAAKPK